MPTETAQSKYLGELRCENTHLKSKTILVTDAPVDNHGKGASFSPTDLVATGLVSCMITVMGIRAEKSNMQMGQVVGSVQKVMGDAPRRILQLNVSLNFQGHNLNSSERHILENIAYNCPVAKSIHPEIVQKIKFSYD